MPEQSTPEEWRPVVGYEGWYDVSDLGRIRRVKAAPGATVGAILKIQPNRNGYATVRLSQGPRRKHARIHQLVARAFLPPPPSSAHELNHKDGVKLNCRANNLEWVTRSENLRHAIANGMRTYRRLAPNEMPRHATLTIEQVREIRRLSDEGMSRVEVARLFNIGADVISQIALRRTWRNFD